MRALLLCLSLCLPGLSWSWGREISRDEEVVFLPQVAWQTDNGLRALVDTVVFEFERRPGVHRAFGAYLELDSKQMTAAQQTLFRARSQLFRIDFERGKAPQVQFADGTALRIRPTNAHGRSRTVARLPNTAGSASATTTWLSFQARLPDDDPRRFTGRALLLAATGWSVVSDIDDTIKHSLVRDRRELLLNTFTRPFRAVPGMAEVYRDLAAAGSSFHYVSGSPVQLYAPLQDFLDQEAFPAGTVDLRTLDLSNEIFGTSGGTKSHKLERIGALLQRFPKRRFVLIGDSGEFDPEIYAELLARHPEQVRLVLIRDVTGEPRQAARYQQSYPGDLAARLHVFGKAGELAAVLPTLD